MRRKILIILSPVAVPIYLLIQAAAFVTAACYYLTLTCGLDRLVGRPVSLSRWAIYALAPLVIALSPLALAIQLALWLVVGLGRSVARAGRWQSALGGAWSALAGAAWTALLVWLVLACLSPPTGWAVFGRDVPGLQAHLRAARDDLRLGELPNWMQQRRSKLIARLQQQSMSDPERAGMIGELADDFALYAAMPERYQRFLTGLPDYYHPPEWLTEGVGDCDILWGTLLLGLVLLIRWPGLSAADSTSLRATGFLLRVGATAAAAAASFVAGMGPADRAALIVAGVLIALGLLVLLYRLGAKLLGSPGLARFYSAFIAARLLQRRRIAFFSVGAVTLCVAMVLIVVSVMGGFLDMVRARSRGLLGDLVIDPGNPLQGVPFYQEFIEKIVQWPEVETATPLIYSYGVMRMHPTNYTRAVRIVGIRLHETYQVNDFRNSLFYEEWYPNTTTLDAIEQPLWGVQDGQYVLPLELQQALCNRGPLPPEYANRQVRPFRSFPGPGVYASTREGRLGQPVWDAAMSLTDLSRLRADLRDAQPQQDKSPLSNEWISLQREIADTIRQAAPQLPEDPQFDQARGDMTRGAGMLAAAADQLDSGRAAEAEQLQNQAWQILEGVLDQLREFLDNPRHEGPKLPGIIIGADLIAERAAGGHYRRYSVYPRGCRVDLTVVPVTPKGSLLLGEGVEGPKRTYGRYVDDSHTGVHEIDSFCVYVDFDLLQDLLLMGPAERTPEDGGGMTSARCSQVQIKLSPQADPLALRTRIAQAWQEHMATVSADPFEQSLMANAGVYTWEEMQAVYIAAVEKEKILVTVLFGVISLVAVFLVLCIFYMIVQEKTRDIGIIKSIGGSSAGVAGIFLGYGAAIGAVGSLLGAVVGTLFVRYINELQEWLASIHPSLRVWSAEVYVFDRIPNEVKPADVMVIVVVAILAAVVGAAIPAWRAARTWPAETLRYE
ncbi:MAG TPA: FtsX-like permease family protein [Phycisphaerae bacterium]|nr:FtsX-like permease family protein [Phycisphaerae bacterium]